MYTPQFAMISLSFSRISITPWRAVRWAGAAWLFQLLGIVSALAVGPLPYLPVLARLDTGSAGLALAISGHYAFITKGTAGLQVVDFANPTNPVTVANLTGLGNAVGIAVSPPWAIVIEEPTGPNEPAGFHVVDVTEPTAPRRVGGMLLQTAGGIALTGHYACVAGGTAGLAVIDFSHPDQPIRIGTYATSSDALAVACEGPRAYVSVLNVGLIILDLQEPTRPTLLGQITDATVDVVTSIQPNGGRVYLTRLSAFGAGSMVVADVSIPAAPTILSQVGIPPLFSSRTGHGVAASGRYAYVAGESVSLVLDVSFPSAAVQVGWAERSRGLAASGDYVLSVFGSHLAIQKQFQPQETSVGFATSQFAAQETTGTIFVPVQRRGDTNSTATVDYTTADESATAGEDYVAQHGTLFFAPGEILKNIRVPIRNDGHAEETESFQISLSVTGAAPILEPFASTHVVIADNDSGVGFLVARTGVREDSGVAELIVQRGDDWPGAITVDYATSEGTATADRDYFTSHGTLHFAAGETRKLISIPILEDRIIEATETLVIHLSGLSPEVSYGPRTNVNLHIADNDIVRPPPIRRRHLLAAASGLYAIKQDGSLWGWGYVIGLGGPTNAPTPIGMDRDWFSVAASGDHALALKTNGSLWAWGANWDGQLGLGFTGELALTPTRVGLDHDWIDIAAGPGFSLGLKADGTLWAWGVNWSGRLGNASIESTNAPVRIAQDSSWISVSAGDGHVYGVQSNGSLWAWGQNYGGLLGVDSVPCCSVFSPLQVGFDFDWEAVTTAARLDREDFGPKDLIVGYTLALKSDGSLWTWAGTSTGRPGFQTGPRTPERVNLDSDWAAAATGSAHAMALKIDGSLWTWGGNYNGELGIGQWPGGDTPRRVGFDFDWVEICAGRSISLALKFDGSLWAWGWLGESNAYAPTQIGPERDWAIPDPSTPSAEGTIVLTDHWRDAQGTFHFAFSHTNHRAYYVLYRGSNVTEIQQPVGATLAGRRPLLITDPTPPTGPGSTFYRIKAYPVVDPTDLDSDGLNDVYELQHADVLDPFQAADATADSDGDGRSNRREFTDGTNPAGAEHWTVATAGLNHSLVLKSDRSLWAWGLNQSGQLGDGTHESRAAPFRVGSDQNWASVSTSHNAFQTDHTVALKLDGTLWAWGDNSTGQLGIGTNTQTSDVPIQISPAPFWASIAAGDSYTLAIHRDGTLWGCGRSRTTGLNLGPELRWVPGNDWSAVAAGAGHALALKTNGTLWAWGDNVLGQCAQLEGDVIDEWTQIGTATDWIAIAASGDGDWFDGSHSLAVKADGTLWAWGGNSFGECGFNSEEAPVRIPTRVGSGTNWIDIAAGCGRSLARQRDGTLWAWGSGLGNQPVQVDPGHNWRFFAAGGPSYDPFLFAIKDDGTLWTTSSPGLTPARFGHENTWGFPP